MIVHADRDPTLWAWLHATGVHRTNGIRHPIVRFRRLGAAFVLMIIGGAAHADSDGPDYLRVTGVRNGNVLNVRAEPAPSAQQIGVLPADADGIRNLGCRGGLTFVEWERASAQEREAGERRRWCRIEFRGITGWAAGRYLAEGTAPSAAVGDAVLVGVRWRLVESPAGVAVGDAWMTIASDGAIAGRTGCNSFRATARIEGNRIVTGPAAMTRMMCAAPVAAQETALVALLGAPIFYEVVDGRLRLDAAEGSRAWQFEPAR